MLLVSLPGAGEKNKPRGGGVLFAVIVSANGAGVKFVSANRERPDAARRLLTASDGKKRIRTSRWQFVPRHPDLEPSRGGFLG